MFRRDFNQHISNRYTSRQHAMYDTFQLHTMKTIRKFRTNPPQPTKPASSPICPRHARTTSTQGCRHENVHENMHLIQKRNSGSRLSSTRRQRSLFLLTYIPGDYPRNTMQAFFLSKELFVICPTNSRRCAHRLDIKIQQHRNDNTTAATPLVQQAAPPHNQTALFRGGALFRLLTQTDV